MKRLLTICTLSATILFASCKKENNRICWECSFGQLNGQNYPDKAICNDGETPGPFHDAAGNDLTFICNKK